MNTRAAMIVASLLLSAALPAKAVPFGVLLESDADRAGGSEVYALTYDSWADVLANNIGPQGFTQLDINPAYSTAGFTFDGTSYRMLLESYADRAAGSEFYALTYDTWADVLANNIGPQGFTQLDINPLYSSQGFAALAFPTSEPTPVPEPSTLALLVLSLGWLAAARRNRVPS